jgi:hypothetical protein
VTLPGVGPAFVEALERVWAPDSDPVVAAYEAMMGAGSPPPVTHFIPDAWNPTDEERAFMELAGLAGHLRDND